MNNPVLIVRYNPKSRLYLFELLSQEAKTVIPAPRWVQDRLTLEVWLNDRLRDGTFPENTEITFEHLK